MPRALGGRGGLSWQSRSPGRPPAGLRPRKRAAGGEVCAAGSSAPPRSTCAEPRPGLAVGVFLSLRHSHYLSPETPEADKQAPGPCARTRFSGGSCAGERSVRRRRCWSKRRTWRRQSAPITSRLAWLPGADEVAQMQARNACYQRPNEWRDLNYFLNTL